MAGIDARTGRPIAGWPHVMQSVGKIFGTRIGARVGRRWFGSMVPALLGNLIVTSAALRFVTAVYVAIELWEPRLKSHGGLFASGPDAVATGTGDLDLPVTYLPRGHLGDSTPAGRRIIARESLGA